MGWLLMLMLMLVACAGQRQDAHAPYAAEALYEASEDMETEAAIAMLGGRGSARSKRQMAAGPETPVPPPAAVSPSAPSEPSPDAQPQTPATGRMVYYNGTARLRVAKVDETHRQLQALAAKSGGLVESQYARAITLRVPVARFQEVYDQILLLGDVLDKRISASDITDHYTATALRLQTSRTTRDRLIELLALAEDDRDKLFLIREIQRLTEEIDRLEGNSRSLESMASLSRITVQLVPRAKVTWRGSGEDATELAWIRALSPFRMDVAREHRKLPLAAPGGMVDLQEPGHWVAESADGARVWSASLPNEPRGTVEFWLSALETRLADEFSAAEIGTVGGGKTLRLVSRDDAPYVWVVGVRVVGNRLHLIEQFYPSLAHEARYREAVHAMLSGGGEA
jgi:hypothetical protein